MKRFFKEDFLKYKQNVRMWLWVKIKLSE
jgi:hypothetical protein